MAFGMSLYMDKICDIFISLERWRCVVTICTKLAVKYSEVSSHIRCHQILYTGCKYRLNARFLTDGVLRSLLSSMEKLYMSKHFKKETKSKGEGRLKVFPFLKEENESPYFT